MRKQGNFIISEEWFQSRKLNFKKSTALTTLFSYWLFCHGIYDMKKFTVHIKTNFCKLYFLDNILKNKIVRGNYRCTSTDI